MPRLKEMFKKTSYIPIMRSEEKPASSDEKEKQPVNIPEGLFTKCPKCSQMVYKEDVKEQHYSCPKCGGYFRIKANTRIRMILDKDTFEEWDKDLLSDNPLDYPGYEEKLSGLRSKTRLNEAVKTGRGKIAGQEVVFGVCDARFLMGSMGYAVGEKITRAVERATMLKLPVILFCCSGGARMQEGIVSLMQMAKTSAAIKKHSEEGLLYIPVLTDPTTGGVTASFAMLGDIILAEPNALIGFAGPRVIQQTIGQKLPDGFQRAEFLVEHGIIDGIIKRDEMRDVLRRLIAMHNPENAYLNFQYEEKVMDSVQSTSVKIDQEQSAWDRVLLARDKNRPVSLDYINSIFSGFYELHGDRLYQDDGAVIGGLAYIGTQPVTVIGIQKGKDTKENVKRNFGMPSPRGYTKALRLMKQAEKFQRPIVCFVDTPGAFCGIEAEENGQGSAIAANLMEMSALKVPVLSIIIGEGGSGGALALAVGDEVWMMENAVYSILSPEGFASILWKDSKRADEAAAIMKITAEDLKKLQIIEKIIPEQEPATLDNIQQIVESMKKGIYQFLEKRKACIPEEIARDRYARFRKF